MNVEESGGKLKDHKEAKLQLVNVEENLPSTSKACQELYKFLWKKFKINPNTIKLI